MIVWIAAASAAEPPLVDAQAVIPTLQVELKYSTTDNFLHQDVYGDFTTCELREDAAAMLSAADAGLRAAHPDLRLHAYDCARPHHVQEQMWAVVKGTAQQGYVADPASGSIHNFGCAIDLSLADAGGVPLDMGTPFDFFGQAAQPRHERELLLTGALTGAQVANRLILREVMLRAGFLPLDNEWWHFDCAPAAEVHRRYTMIP